LTVGFTWLTTTFVVRPDEYDGDTEVFFFGVLQTFLQQKYPTTQRTMAPPMLHPTMIQMVVVERAVGDGNQAERWILQAGMAQADLRFQLNSHSLEDSLEAVWNDIRKPVLVLLESV
jgi:hypothetical protein